MITFTDFNLNSTIYKAITACGYTTPTPVQAKSIPEIMVGRDVAVSAQTGTGKTAAFVLPILHRLSTTDRPKAPSVLILTPTRELANQIIKAVDTYGKYLHLRTVSLVGGMPYPPQIKKLKQGVDMIVATPGRLIDHIEQERIDLSEMEVLVLDEADRMLDMGFIDDVRYIAERTPSDRQTLLFSATLDSKLLTTVKSLLNKPVRIDLSNERITAPQIKQEMYKVQHLQHKSRLLKHFLNDENIYKAIIFCATKSHAEKLALQLSDEGFAAGALHGDLRQNARNRILEQFRRGKIQFLVATDVAARGIDVNDITHVINFDLPRFCEDYVHRIGRTGRAGKTGVAISFVSSNETKHLRSIERYIGQRIQLNELDLAEKGTKNGVAIKESVPLEMTRRPYVQEFKKKSFRKNEGHHDTEHSNPKIKYKKDFRSAKVKHSKPRPNKSHAHKGHENSSHEHKAREHKAHENRSHEHKAREHKGREHRSHEHKTREHKAHEHKNHEHKTREHKSDENKTHFKKSKKSGHWRDQRSPKPNNSFRKKQGLGAAKPERFKKVHRRSREDEKNQ